MKPLKAFLLIMVMGMAVTAFGQQRLPLRTMRELRMQRLKSLQLTTEQKIRLLNLVRTQQMQNHIDQKELDEILTARQKRILLYRRRKEKAKDSNASYSPGLQPRVL